MRRLTLSKMSNSLRRTVTQVNNSGLKDGLNRAETAPLAAKASNTKRFPIHRPINSPSYASRSIQDSGVTLWTKRQRLDTEGFWETYKKFMRLDQAGIATIAYYNTGPHNRCSLIAVKEHRVDKGPAKEFNPCKSPQIIHLLDIHYNDDSIYFVYEHMKVSLHQISSTLRTLNHLKIRAVCKEVF